MKLILTNLKHFSITAIILLAIFVSGVVAIGGHIGLAEDSLAYKIGNEGPHVFYEGGKLAAHYIRGGSKEGFHIEKYYFSEEDGYDADVYFPLEETSFSVNIKPDITIPEATYDDGEPIIAISDVESNYKTFRDFLIAQKVTDSNLNWTFGRGHLVLVGDFVDRGASTTQVLWLIYKLEQSAKRAGGKVHFILGNHEIKNLQGNYQRAADKYFYVAATLGKQQYDLFSDDAFLGRWLASKNTVERINGVLFMHGGIHPDLVEADVTLDDVNRIVRANYRQAYVPVAELTTEDLLIHTRFGTSWYRGYFEADLSQETVEAGLQKFGAKAVVVGHQPQWSVSSHYEGKVLAIDVKHPEDYSSSFPIKRSEGLLIEGENTYRLLDDGSRDQL